MAGPFCFSLVRAISCTADADTVSPCASTCPANACRFLFFLPTVPLLSGFHLSLLTAWPAWLAWTSPGTRAPVGASLCTTCPQIQTKACSGSCLGRSAQSTTSRWSVTSTPTSAKASASSPWQITTRRQWPSPVSTATGWATASCKSPSRLTRHTSPELYQVEAVAPRLCLLQNWPQPPPTPTSTHPLAPSVTTTTTLLQPSNTANSNRNIKQPTNHQANWTRNGLYYNFGPISQRCLSITKMKWWKRSRVLGSSCDNAGFSLLYILSVSCGCYNVFSLLCKTVANPCIPLFQRRERPLSIGAFSLSWFRICFSFVNPDPLSVVLYTSPSSKREAALF